MTDKETELREGTEIISSKDKEKIKLYNHHYYEQNKVAILEQQKEYVRRHSQTPEGKVFQIAKTNRMTAKYPEKYKARYILRNAIRLGHIRLCSQSLISRPLLEQLPLLFQKSNKAVGNE